MQAKEKPGANSPRAAKRRPPALLAVYTGLVDILRLDQPKPEVRDSRRLPGLLGVELERDDVARSRSLRLNRVLVAKDNSQQNAERRNSTCFRGGPQLISMMP